MFVYIGKLYTEFYKTGSIGSYIFIGIFSLNVLCVIREKIIFSIHFNIEEKSKFVNFNIQAISSRKSTRYM